MNDQSRPGQTLKRKKPISIKLAIGLTIFIGLIIVSILVTGVVATYLYPVATPELVTRIQDEKVAGEKATHQSDVNGQTALATHETTTTNTIAIADYLGTRAGNDEPPLLPPIQGIPADKIEERDRLNSMYKQCTDILSECADWDRMNFKERKTKLEQVRSIQQFNPMRDLMYSQFDIENSLLRAETNPTRAAEHQKTIEQMYIRYNAIIDRYKELSLENAIRNEQWFYAAAHAPKASDMIYYYRRSNISGLQKFGFITTRTIERGYHSFANAHPSVRRFMPNW